MVHFNNAVLSWSNFFDGVTPNGSSKFSIIVSFYLGNDTRYGHSYNGRQIETCMRSIEWCHFQ